MFGLIREPPDLKESEISYNPVKRLNMHGHRVSGSKTLQLYRWKIPDIPEFCIQTWMAALCCAGCLFQVYLEHHEPANLGSQNTTHEQKRLEAQPIPAQIPERTPCQNTQKLL